MEVLIIATKGCSHCRNLAKELDDLGIEHRLVFAESEPELVEKYSIRHSPNLIVDNEVRFRRQPTEQELRDCLNL
ncbi:MAG: thioredoxin family protein [Gammaproteobacteria bacterium]|nr:thioredoxin family protein [Gammaproteobacteria bacterium]